MKRVTLEKEPNMATSIRTSPKTSKQALSVLLEFLTWPFVTKSTPLSICGTLLYVAIGILAANLSTSEKPLLLSAGIVIALCGYILGYMRHVVPPSLSKYRIRGDSID
ncbi:MAG: hypothetical protein ACYCZ0_02880 [Minisyncoccota bacterium]